MGKLHSSLSHPFAKRSNHFFFFSTTFVSRDYQSLNACPKDHPSTIEPTYPTILKPETSSSSAALVCVTASLEPNPPATQPQQMQHAQHQHNSNVIQQQHSTENEQNDITDVIPTAVIPSIQRLNSCTSSSSSSGVVTNFHSKSLSQNQSCESSQSNFSTFESLDLNTSESCDLAVSLPSCATDTTVVAASGGGAAMGGGGGTATPTTGNDTKDNGMSLFTQNRNVIRSI